MDKNTEEYGAKILMNGFIILPTTALDAPIYDSGNETAFTEYLLYDEDENIIGGMSINEHRAKHPNRKIIYTVDGLYAYYGLQIGFMKESQTSLKVIMGDAGLKIGKVLDDAAMDKYWISNMPELKEWIAATPHNQPPEPI